MGTLLGRAARWLRQSPAAKWVGGKLGVAVATSVLAVGGVATQAGSGSAASPISSAPVTTPDPAAENVIEAMRAYDEAHGTKRVGEDTKVPLAFSPDPTERDAVATATISPGGRVAIEDEAARLSARPGATKRLIPVVTDDGTELGVAVEDKVLPKGTPVATSSAPPLDVARADEAAASLIHAMEQDAARRRILAAIDPADGGPEPGAGADAAPEFHETVRLTDAGRERVRKAAARLHAGFFPLATQRDFTGTGSGRALVIVPPLDRPDTQSEYQEFRHFGEEAARALQGQGMTARIVTDALWEDVRRQLQDAAAAGAPFDRVVIVSHGGWDGPLLGKDLKTRQYSGNTWPDGTFMGGEGWEGLVAALRAGTTPDARIYVSACHAGGSDPNAERDVNQSDYRYVDDLARRTGRFVAGPNGETAAKLTPSLLLAADGAGEPGQDIRVASPGGTLTIPGPDTIGRMSPGELDELHQQLGRLQRGEPVAGGPRTGFVERVGQTGQ